MTRTPGVLPFNPRVAVQIVSGVAVLAGVTAAAAQPRSAPCAATRGREHDTIIVFQPPSTFTICRDAKPQDDVVTGRPVYFELTPTPGSRMFDFRVHGQSSDWTPTGLSTWQQQALRISGGLHEMEHSNEPISTLAIPLEAPSGPPSPLRPVAAARSRYLGVVTPQYLDVLQGVRDEARELPVIATVVRRWCGELGADAAASIAVGAELQARCAGPELREGALERDLGVLEASATKFEALRTRARDATVAAIAHPEDPTAVADAVRSLDEARGAAASAVTATSALRDSSKELALDIATLRSAIRSIDAIRPGVPTYLSTYAAPGNAELEIDATPVDIASVGQEAAHNTAGTATARFPIVGRHYLDLEAGLGFTAGLPQFASIASNNGKPFLQGKPVDEFVGLALVELEPARFLWPDRPLAGLLRLPVLGVPFTRDPTQNFFIGAGLGWTGIGSITAGPYLLRELTPSAGHAFGEVLDTGTTLDAVTEPTLQVGYFVSASVDLLGLFHVFFPVHPAAIDAATGKEK